jgi:transaldolase
MNELQKITGLGQSIWLDYLDRELLNSGRLAALIRDDGLTGVTSNPQIFLKAIAGHRDYDLTINALVQKGADAVTIYETLALEDVRHAADLLYPVYKSTKGHDGFVSLEVAPGLAHDAGATIREARRLWGALDRHNVMIKVPGTTAGVAAFEEIIAAGINVNVTLLFSVVRYREVQAAYCRGLERLRAGVLPRHVASVASFFLSRIDTAVDRQLDQLGTPQAQALRGQAAIACARLAYQEFLKFSACSRWEKLQWSGARPQRLLWASTSAKDPQYRDTRYVEALIGPGTINTLPPATLDAFREHGKAEAHLESDVKLAEQLPAALQTLGIDLEVVAAQLEVEGVRAFSSAYEELLTELNQRL